MTLLADIITEQATTRAMSVREIVKATLDAMRCSGCFHLSRGDICVGLLRNQHIGDAARFGCRGYLPR
jgi:hypothetical protein